jgi:hypothetical protein
MRGGWVFDREGRKGREDRLYVFSSLSSISSAIPGRNRIISNEIITRSVSRRCSSKFLISAAEQEVRERVSSRVSGGEWSKSKKIQKLNQSDSLGRAGSRKNSPSRNFADLPQHDDDTPVFSSMIFLADCLDLTLLTHRDQTLDSVSQPNKLLSLQRFCIDIGMSDVLTYSTLIARTSHKQTSCPECIYSGRASYGPEKS